MKRGCWFVFLVLVLGSSAVPSEDWTRNRKLKAICFLKYPADGEESLRRNCRHTAQDIEVLDEEAKANVTILRRDNDYVVLAFEPGIYIVERRTENGTWEFAETLPQSNDPEILQTTWTYRMFDRRGARVQLRFHRAFSTGLSKPETTDWIEKNNVDGVDEALPVKNLGVESDPASGGDPATIGAEISFDPEEGGGVRD